MNICDYFLCFYSRIMYDLIPVYELYKLLYQADYLYLTLVMNVPTYALSMTFFIKITSKVYFNISIKTLF